MPTLNGLNLFETNPLLEDPPFGTLTRMEIFANIYSDYWSTEVELICHKYVRMLKRDVPDSFWELPTATQRDDPYVRSLCSLLDLEVKNTKSNKRDTPLWH